MQPDGIISRKHMYLFQGVTAVCVPQFNFVFQGYLIEDHKPDKFPRPWLLGLHSEWSGDLKTAAFLSQLLDHLDLDAEVKRTQRRMFLPIVSELRTEPLLDLFGENWQPTLSASQIDKVLTPVGAREYVQRVHRFFAGDIQPAEIPIGLEHPPAPLS